MVQFTTIVAMVGMPMLVMASRLSETLTGPPLAQRTVQTSGPLYGLDTESATFSVYGLDGNAKTISVNYKNAGGDGHDNANGAWFAVTVEGGNGDPAKKIDPKNAGNVMVWNEWLGKANDNPVIILTSDKPTAEYLVPNHYYTVYQQNQEDKTHVLLWNTTTQDTQHSFIQIHPIRLRMSTRYMYHL
ncbi:hypothetical protein L204_104422 [Cryptococcus depauperatus]